MRSPALRALLLPFTLALLTGCGDEAKSAPSVPQRPQAQHILEPWDTVAPERLYGATPVENLRTTRVELDALNLPAGWDGMRIAVISDLHLGLWPDNEAVAAAAVRRALESRADLVVLLGDFVAGAEDTTALARVLAPLRGRMALAVLGDRDVRTDSLEAAVTRTLAASGVRLLNDQAVPLTRNGATAQVAGLHPDLAGKSWGDQEWVLSTIGGGAPTPLLLSHLPTMATRAPEGRFAGILAGNTFCGRVEVPGTPRLAWLVSEALPGAAIPEVERLFRIKENTLFVTCGVGYGFVPVRFGAPPEVALVTLRAIGTGAPAADAGASVPDSLLQRFQQRDSAADTTRG